MSNDSSTGGPLAFATSPAPLEGQALYRFLQQFFIGICTAIPGNLFFPMWQLEPPDLPPVGTDWAAFGIRDRKSDTFAFFRHVPQDNTPMPPVPGYDEFQRHEELSILIAIYGPNADQNAATLRDGLQVRQNLDPLEAQNMGLIETGDLLTTPELVKEQWLYRVDLPVKIRRQILRQIPILDLLGADITLNNELYTTDITVN
jgi:hypothetical protein